MSDETKEVLDKFSLYVFLEDIKKSLDAENMEEAKEKLAQVQLKMASDRVLANEVKEWVERQVGVFTNKDIYQELDIRKRKDKKNVSTILARMEKEGLIERSRKRSGVWRRIDDEAEPMDFVNAPVEEVPVKWPFGIEEMVRIFPRNIIVVAGHSNAGKTCFLFNFIRMNMEMEDYDIYYFNSEMGEIELKERLGKFEGMDLDSWKFYPFERSCDFHDVIRPDDINIIDYLEIGDSFYMVANQIAEIHRSLSKGIAIIALQKDRGRDYGRGASFSLEKPRLYLSIDPGRIKIVKAKNWRTEENPNGLIRYFKIIQGAKFIPDGDWHKDGDDPFRDNQYKKTWR